MPPGGIRSRGFRALLLSQLLGALTDNFTKVLVSLLAVNNLISGGSFGEVVLGGVCFVLPFLLFSPFAGSLADKLPKSRVIRIAKVLELFAAVLAASCIGGQILSGLLVSLFLLGAHSALFSPAKYGMLPEILPEEELSRGNGLLELCVFLGAIGGSALGGIVGPNSTFGAALTLLLSSTVGLVLSFFVSPTVAANPQGELRYNPLKLVPVVREIYSIRGLFLAALGISYFWALAGLYQLNLSLSAKQLSGWGDARTAFLLAILGLGIGGGGALAGKVSEGKVELGLVPVGGGFLGLTSFLVSVFYQHYFLTLCAIFVMGISGGFFVIPLSSYFQQNAPAEVRGTYVSAVNWLTYLGTLLAYGLLFLFIEMFHFSPSTMFFVVGLSALSVMLYSCTVMPEMIIRCANWLITHTLYRLEIRGLENIPREGGGLIICNHVAYVDPPIILAAARRPVRFLMFRPIYEAPIIHSIAKAAGAIPISPDSPKRMLKSIQEARAAIENGELVCIFAEGELTRVGHMLSFKKGFERIVKGLNAPVIPAYIDQIWGSIFSHRDGKFFWKIPKQIPYPVTLAFGAPLSSDSPSHVVRQTIQELAADLALRRKEKYPSLQSAFLHVCKRKALSPCVSDSSGLRLRYIELLVASLVTARKLRSLVGEGKRIAVLLPPSVGGVITNIAIAFTKGSSVNLNFTASKESIDFAMEKSNATHIVSNRSFLTKLGFPERAGMLFIEDLLREASWKEKALWAALVLLVPKRFFLRWVMKDHVQRGDLATIIFSSGSTAEPKGVMLSHGNIASNIESLYQIFQLDRKDGVLGCLPFFHSFGYTATIWLPLLSGIRATYHPNPMEAATIGEIVQKERITLLMSTPTFLLGYIRKCTAEQFKSLRYVIVGAEKLKDRIATSFVEKFGVAPMEGYGATELSPVAMMNVPDYRDAIIKQTGHKPGTVGHPLPGVAVRVVDPDSFAALEPNQEGLLLVRGPNVMLGYLGNEEKTREVIRDGWYVTGDIAKLDEDGFVVITDRLSRFSKIAGEMVPHIKVEEAIHEVLGEKETVCAVTAVADEKKGERLIVLSTKSLDSADVVKRLSEKGLPNLWIPKKESFFVIDALPQLGTGKLDLKALKVMAAEQSSRSAGSVE